MSSKIDGNLIITGHLTVGTMDVPAAAVDNASIDPAAEIARSKLALDQNKQYRIPLTACRVWDNPSLPLPAAESITRQIGTRAKVGATAGWVVGAADNLPYVATLPASQTGSTLVIPIDGLRIGDTITGFRVVAQIESAGNTVTIDGDLRATTNVAAEPTDASIGTMTQISVTADNAASQQKTGLTETVTSGKTYYLLLTATTGASTDVILQACEITVDTPAANSDDLGIYAGTWGTHGRQVKSGDLKAAGSTTRYLGLQVPIPAEYEDAETVTIRIRAGMETTVADVAATVDVEAYLPDGTGAVGSDLCSTAVQSINSLTDADKDFVITSTGIVAGDVLEVRVAVLVNDAATVTAVIAAIQEISLLADVRG
jgi:hypothetical protein